MIRIRSAELETVCGITSRLPVNPVAEVAFAGKSNVGKSSLINGLMQRKALARTSAQPGKTQTVNFYRVNRGTDPRECMGENPFAPDCFLVDLPGYGFANTSQAVKEKWGRMIENYLGSSSRLCRVFLLVDIRHRPSANDRQMMEWIRAAGLPAAVIATKSDKLKKAQIQKARAEIKKELELSGEVPVLPFSALTKEGAEEIWRLIIGTVYTA